MAGSPSFSGAGIKKGGAPAALEQGWTGILEGKWTAAGLIERLPAIAEDRHTGIIETEARAADRAALAAFDIDAADADSVVMIGNHLSRDVSGANRRGIISIWQSWSPRREKQATAPDEVPDYVVRTPGEIPALLEFIELTMARQATHRAMSALAPVSITG